MQRALHREASEAPEKPCKASCGRIPYGPLSRLHAERASRMSLRASLLRQLDNPALSPDGRAELRCQAARELEEAGDYEAAREAMGELWPRYERPNVEGLEPSTAAEVLLRAGTLTGWIGSCNQIRDAQEAAKNLITEAARIFEAVNYPKKILEARTELAYCYWREGSYDEARIILKDVLAQLTADSELKAKAVLRLAIVEWGAGRHTSALSILTDNAPLFEKINSHTVKGGYHNQLAVVLKKSRRFTEPRRLLRPRVYRVRSSRLSL